FGEPQSGQQIGDQGVLIRQMKRPQRGQVGAGVGQVGKRWDHDVDLQALHEAINGGMLMATGRAERVTSVLRITATGGFGEDWPCCHYPRWRRRPIWGDGDRKGPGGLEISA